MTLLSPRQRPLALALAALVLVPLAGCDTLSGPDYEDQLVVSAVLEVGEPLPTIRLGRTVPLGQPTNPSSATVSGATVSVTLVGADGSAQAVVAYVSGLPGEYLPTEGDAVLPGRRYRLDVAAPGFDDVTGETETPEAIALAQAPPDEVVYRGAAAPFGPSFRVTASSTAERQSVYLIGVRAEAPDDYEVVDRGDGTFGFQRQFTPGRFGPTPDVQAVLEGVDCEPSGDGFTCDFFPDDLAEGNSPLLNEETYVDNGDGTITVTVPWLAVSFYGPHTFTLNALDDALVDFIATQAVQFNPTTLSPGEIPNVTSNLSGPAVGVFGSYAAVAVRSTISEG